MKSRELIYLIKFVDENYINSFLENGQIHFESLYYFSELERKKNDERIGDAFEGNMSFNPLGVIPCFYMQQNKQGKIIQMVPFKPSNLRLVKGLGDEGRKRLGICSFFYISTEDVETFKGNDGNLYYKFNDKTVSMLREFMKNDDRVPVMIHNVSKFAKRCEKRGTILRPVFYYNEHDYEYWDKTTTNNPIFYSELKRKKYESQHEVRLIKQLRHLNEGENIEIGNIKDIAAILDRETLYKNNYIARRQTLS